MLIGWFANTAYHLPKSSNPIAQIKPTPLNKYSIDNLSNISIKPSQIEIGSIIKVNKKYTSYKFIMRFSPDFSDNIKATSGVINIPNGDGPFPIIVMFRGYVDQKLYIIGEGTQPAAMAFATNGYITIAPDFLGYGDSDPEADDIFESRFQTYVTAVELIKSLNSIKQWDSKNVFIWGHSNGGQIALTALEITGVNYPTALWAPVSKPFPYSILTYTDEASDGGRLIITKLAEFEDTYDTTMFSLTNYFGKIKALIQLNQGTVDTAVPYWWSDSLVKILEDSGVEVIYKKYPGNDHNMRPNWSAVIENNLLFYKSYLK